MTHSIGGVARRGLLVRINGPHHRAALTGVTIIVLTRWAGHLVQASQIVFLFPPRPGFVGRARTWWTVALAVQFWHHIEHLLLLLHAQTRTMFSGQKVPARILHLVVPRVEPHLFYSSIVSIPMHPHPRPNAPEYDLMACSRAGRGVINRTLASHAV